jgi:hypothetical protein
MKYYLVALFDSDSYKNIEEIQKNVCKKYKLYKNSPSLHIKLEVIGDPDMEKLDQVISKLIKPYKKFKIEVCDAISIDEPYKSVNLKIQNKGYISRLARTINDTLKLHGFVVREDLTDEDLHISLANTNHSIKELSKQENSISGKAMRQDGFYKFATVDKIELWKPINNKKETVLKTYSLKDF